MSYLTTILGMLYNKYSEIDDGMKEKHIYEMFGEL
jgi:hypothetical protein